MSTAIKAIQKIVTKIIVFNW